MRRSTIRRLAIWTAVAAMIVSAGLAWLRPLRTPPTPPVIPPPPEKRVTLAAVGDVLLGRGVARKIKKLGADYPFEYVSAIISSADIAFLNLECPMTTRGRPQKKAYTFRADPALAQTLCDTGFDIANLANNHIFDYGRVGLLDTVEAVRKAGLSAVGAGKNREEALKMRVVEQNGLRVGFIAYTDFPGSGLGDNPEGKPTVAAVAPKSLPDQVKKAKTQCDILVVSFHWGIEYQKKPNERQITLARLAIDNGADLVLGHHPHVLQTVEVYRDKPIVYSMGGLVWDGRRAATKISAIYLFDMGRSSTKLVGTVPINIAGYRPYPIYASKPAATKRQASAK